MKKLSTIVFAHIYIDHDKDASNNYQLSVDRFIKNLKQKISIKCAISSDCNFILNKEAKQYLTSKDSSRGIHVLKWHYKQVHLVDPKTCDKCGKEFRNGIYLKSHLRKGCQEENKQCPECGKVLIGAYNLERHIRNYHLKNLQKHCTECGKTFYDIRGLKTHTNTIHKKLRNFICDICGKKSGQFYNLNVHRLSVHGAKFPSITDYRRLISSGKHTFVTNVEEALKAKA